MGFKKVWSLVWTSIIRLQELLWDDGAFPDLSQKEPYDKCGKTVKN